MKKIEILNLTNHNATPEQIAAGVIEPTKEDKEKIKELLTFIEIPTKSELEKRADYLKTIVLTYGVDHVMLGGAPYLMSILEKKLKLYQIRPMYSFTKRETEEKLEGNEVKKISIFKHIGWVFV